VVGGKTEIAAQLEEEGDVVALESLVEEERGGGLLLLLLCWDGEEPEPDDCFEVGLFVGLFVFWCFVGGEED
jgi:hypothetical protein